MGMTLLMGDSDIIRRSLSAFVSSGSNWPSSSSENISNIPINCAKWRHHLFLDEKMKNEDSVGMGLLLTVLSAREGVGSPLW